MSTDQTKGRQSSESSSNGMTDVEDASTEEADQPALEISPEDIEGVEEGADPDEKIAALTERVGTLKKERDELNDRVLRKAAEFENYRRRMDREKKRRHESGMLEVVEPILEVLDDFERSLDAAEELGEKQDAESAYDSLKGGVEMVFRKFRDTLETLGIEPIEAEGEPFDENLHDAMMRQPSEEAEPGTVLQEIRKGYRKEDRVIRHSRVVVAAEPEDDDNSEEAADEEA